MKSIRYLVSFVFFLFAQYGISQIMVKGEVADAEGTPIKGAIVFVDSVKIGTKTDKKGIFKIKLDPDAKNVTVYSEKHGISSTEYNGGTEISFRFSEDAGPLSEKDLGEMGFKLKMSRERNATNYADYATIYDLLKAKFPQVRVTSDQRIIISKGINTYSGNTEPLVLVNGQPRSNIGTIPTSEIKSIRVIQKGDEASEYGLRGVNGVLLITLKD